MSNLSKARWQLAHITLASLIVMWLIMYLRFPQITNTIATQWISDIDVAEIPMSELSFIFQNKYSWVAGFSEEPWKMLAFLIPVLTSPLIYEKIHIKTNLWPGIVYGGSVGLFGFALPEVYLKIQRTMCEASTFLGCWSDAYMPAVIMHTILGIVSGVFYIYVIRYRNRRGHYIPRQFVGAILVLMLSAFAHALFNSFVIVGVI